MFDCITAINRIFVLHMLFCCRLFVAHVSRLTNKTMFYLFYLTVIALLFVFYSRLIKRFCTKSNIIT